MTKTSTKNKKAMALIHSLINKSSFARFCLYILAVYRIVLLNIRPLQVSRLISYICNHKYCPKYQCIPYVYLDLRCTAGVAAHLHRRVTKIFCISHVDGNIFLHTGLTQLVAKRQHAFASFKFLKSIIDRLRPVLFNRRGR